MKKDGPTITIRNNTKKPIKVGTPVDMVNKPPHYRSPFKTSYGAYLEAIDVIEAFGLGFNLGNVIKYICRSGKKRKNPPLQDLKKAQFYLSREIERIEELKGV